MKRRTSIGSPGRPTRLRWLAAPGLAATLIVAITVMPSLASAQSPPPSLPPITPQDLVVKVQQAHIDGLSGTLSLKTDLGLPDLGGLVPGGASGGGNNFLMSLLTGDHTAKVWVAGDKFRVAFPTQMAESAIISNGTDLWLWQSDSQSVTHFARTDTDRRHSDNDTDANSGSATETNEVAPTPQAIADKLLSNLDPSTRVFVRDTAAVADRPAYELVLAPRSDTTLVADVVIAVDSETGLPLRVQVLGRDSGSPSLEIGFTDVDFSVPGDSNFQFTPPPGANVTEATSPQDLVLPHDTPGDRPRVHRRMVDGMGPTAPGDGGTQTPIVGATPRQAKPDVQTVGEAWDTIVKVTPAPGTGQAPGDNQLADILRRLGSPVSGPWGSGNLVHSSLVNVLVLDDGRILAGSVTEAALEAAV